MLLKGGQEQKMEENRLRNFIEKYKSKYTTVQKRINLWNKFKRLSYILLASNLLMIVWDYLFKSYYKLNTIVFVIYAIGIYISDLLSLLTLKKLHTDMINTSNLIQENLNGTDISNGKIETAIYLNKLLKEDISEFIFVGKDFFLMVNIAKLTYLMLTITSAISINKFELASSVFLVLIILSFIFTGTIHKKSAFTVFKKYLLIKNQYTLILFLFEDFLNDIEKNYSD